MPRFSVRLVYSTLAALLLVLIPSRAHADPSVTLWAGPHLPLGTTKSDVDVALGADVDVLRVSGWTLGGSLGYLHVRTPDAGNVHRFPLLAIARRDLASPTAAVGARPYVGAGLGVSFSDENSGDVGVSRRTEPAWAVMIGTKLTSLARAELRFVAAERPSKDGTFVLSFGLRL